MRYLLLAALVALVACCNLVGATEEREDDGLIVKDEGEEVVVREARAAKGRNGKGKAAGGKECRYTKGPWNECNPTTNMRSRTLTLKRGNEGSCETTRLDTKKCKKMCRYVKGHWTDCNVASNQMERIDTLKPGSDNTCESTMKKVKKCKDRCLYGNWSEWTKCSSGTKTKTRPVLVGRGSGPSCAERAVKSKPCSKSRRQ